MFYFPNQRRWSGAAWTCVFLFVCSCASARDFIGPYLQNLTQTSVTICWESDKAEPGVVEYTTDPKGAVATVRSDQATTFHEVTLKDLSPGTAYKYRVKAGDKITGGAFRTAPQDFEPFQFGVIGDTRTGHPTHRQLMAQMLKHSPALILNTGDLVSDGREQPGWDMFWDIVGPAARSVPYYPCLGNHEKDAPQYYQYFSLPDTGGGERQYAFAYGGAWFIVLDTNGGYAVYPKQMKWLKKMLEQGQRYVFIFVMFHEPVFSSSKREPNKILQNTIGPVLSKYRVTAVFNGHDHFYERSVKGGVAFNVSGGGGAPLYDHVRDIPESKGRIKDYEFMIVSVNGKTADFKTYSITNKVIDEFSMTSPR